MSSVTEQGTVVLVRAFGDEPVRLRALATTQRVILVAGFESDESIGFPRDHVYGFAPGLLKRLRVAYDRGDQAMLAQLWREAQPVELGTRA